MCLKEKIMKINITIEFEERTQEVLETEVKEEKRDSGIGSVIDEYLNDKSKANETERIKAKNTQQRIKNLENLEIRLAGLRGTEEKWAFVRENSPVSYILEFPQPGKELVDGKYKYTRTIREKCIPKDIDDLRAAENAFEKFLKEKLKVLRENGIERIPWPANRKWSPSRREYIAKNTESRRATEAKHFNEIYGELRAGIKVDGEIKQQSVFNVYS